MTRPTCYGAFADCTTPGTCKHRFECSRSVIVDMVAKGLERKAKSKKRKDAGFTAPLAAIGYATYLDGRGRVEQIKLYLPCLPPSKNRYTRAHWRTQQQKFFKPWEAWFESEYRQTSRPKLKGVVDVSIECHFKRKNCDTLNYVAFPPLMDCIVKAGIIDDDNAKVCRVTILPPVWDGSEGMVIRITKVRVVAGERGE